MPVIIIIIIFTSPCHSKADIGICAALWLPGSYQNHPTHADMEKGTLNNDDDGLITVKISLHKCGILRYLAIEETKTFLVLIPIPKRIPTTKIK